MIMGSRGKLKKTLLLLNLLFGNKSQIGGMIEHGGLITDFWMEKILPSLIVLLVVIAIVAFSVFTYIIFNTDWPTEFERRQAIFDECMNAEQFTREECVIISAGGTRR